MLVAAQKTEVMRPLKVLVPMIHAELNAGDAAGLEHYRRAGEMLLEAKEQVAHGGWRGWINKNFHLSIDTARRYMTLAEESQKPRARSFSSLRDVTGETGGGKISWQRPVQQVISRVNFEAFDREYENREKEGKLTRQLAHQLVDIGYKVLAAKMHPDKGGSPEAMSRLNKVRKLLKEAL
jgi:hypothetical protein